MMEFERLLEAWNNGVLRGARAKLSKELGVSEVTVSRWAKGELKPGQETIKKMSKIFDISVDKIKEAFGMGAALPPTNMIDGRIELSYVPVRGMSSATAEQFILEEVETYLPFRKTGPNQFAIKIVGNCMVDPDDPRNSIYDGDYVIVDPDAEARNGDVIVARLDGEYSTVKRMYKHKDEVRLVPDNPDCKPIIRTGATFIVGKVIDVYRPVRTKKERKM